MKQHKMLFLREVTLNISITLQSILRIIRGKFFREVFQYGRSLPVIASHFRICCKCLLWFYCIPICSLCQGYCLLVERLWEEISCYTVFSLWIQHSIMKNYRDIIAIFLPSHSEFFLRHISIITVFLILLHSHWSSKGMNKFKLKKIHECMSIMSVYNLSIRIMQ